MGPGQNISEMFLVAIHCNTLTLAHSSPTTPINFWLDCKNCATQGVKTRYIGGTGRSGFERGNEHLIALKKMDENDAGVKHQIEHHPELGKKHAHNENDHIQETCLSPVQTSK